MKIVSNIRDFQKGIKVIFGKPVAGEGDRKLARVSTMVIAQIPVYGKEAVRTQLIKSIENDFKRAAKKGGKAEVDKMIDNALATPEYKTLLVKVGLEEPHIRVLGMQAVKTYAK